MESIPPLYFMVWLKLIHFAKKYTCHFFPLQRDKDAFDVFTSLLALSKPKTVKELYAFGYNPKGGELRRETGWNFHDLGAEFQRQGVPNENWSMCGLNKDYGLCPTYPKVLFVPSTATKELIEGSARFRSRGRLPGN